MRLPTRTPRARHLAGAPRPIDWAELPAEEPAPAPRPEPLGIDVPLDIDIDAADAWDESFDQPRARVARSRVAFAVAVTLAALPLLVLDNFPATADTGTDGGTSQQPPEAVEESDGALSVEVDIDPPLHGTIDLDAPTTLITVAPPTVFVATPVTTVAIAPPTTAAPSTTTSTAVARVAPPTTPAPTTTTVAIKTYSPDPGDPATWEQLARCESGGDWGANTGNGYYGGLQFSLTTWQGLGGTGYPHEATKASQIEMGKRLQARAGWAAWPGCSRKLGWS